MKYLLDASALLPLVTRCGRQLIVKASHENLVTIDLALYEACNSLWKLATLLKSISLEDAIDVATTLKDLATKNIIQPINFTKLDFSETLKKAHKELLTFYDASYITIAERTEAILVTEDEKLRKTASKFVKTITYRDLESMLTQSSQSPQ
ncbi:type II toxin-antitoxin system VapC family toxin [Candidatus Bathyarchaeota archaeon]|nr:type II toxin-antitoxin system VapC family toxin [Candidatus Bathyarchaeota archaeon]MBS7614093.1 type II toxin-antitoxin system VapC family toxin [Candidatus Bathyarchaeota archaeon]MBS7618764.1 type II toxin-antitoxin system VapC family toxin [Candidatus Bathyarchaeota archaeon]